MTNRERAQALADRAEQLADDATKGMRGKSLQAGSAGAAFAALALYYQREADRAGEAS